jgi:signal transduction histidine kinase
MKLRDLGSYLIIPEQVDQPERYLHEMKRLEWIFIAVRWVWVPIVFLMAWLHHPAQTDLMMVLGGVLGFCNIVACLLNIRIKTPHPQHALGLTMLIVDTLLAWGVILLFVRDFYTAAYAGFVYIILEAAIRFGLTGSLSAAGLFVLALYGAFLYREAAFDVRFSVSGYVFWTVLMAIVALAAGAIVHEGKRQRALSERRLRENALLTERHRIARELHDTVLKTLQGLSLEARALGSRTGTPVPSVKETADYIAEVCSRTGREIREVIFDLRSENIKGGIGSQISGMLDEWSKNTGIAADFDLSGEDVMLPPEPARQVRNIVTEVLTNIQRHASASHVSIVINISSGEMDIEIRDNGLGIGHIIDDLHVFVAEGKLGIAGMKERVELLGGRLSLSSDRGGTVINLHVPVSQQTIKDRITNETDKNSYSR